jgi:hypothetical protein
MKNKLSRVQVQHVEDALGLDSFRKQWDGKEILSLLKKYDGHLCINWDVGVGKSYNIDDVIETAIGENRYDLPVVRSVTLQGLWSANLVGYYGSQV